MIRIVKLGVISVIVIFGILTAMGLILPSSILVSRAIDINTDVTSVKRYVFNLDQWNQWIADGAGNLVEVQHDPRNNTLDISGTQVKIVSVSDSVIVTNWSAEKDMLGSFRVIDHNNANSIITVQWQMEQAVKWYPWERFASITKDEIWGAAMEKSLQNLRQLVETQ